MRIFFKKWHGVFFYVSEPGIHHLCMHSIGNRVALSKVETVVSKIWGLRFCPHHAFSLVGDLAINRVITDIKAKLCLCLVLWRETITMQWKTLQHEDLIRFGFRHSFPRIVVSKPHVQWEGRKGTTHTKSPCWRERAWSGPLRKHVCSRQLIGSWAKRIDQGSKGYSFAKEFSGLPPLQFSTPSPTFRS